MLTNITSYLNKLKNPKLAMYLQALTLVLVLLFKYFYVENNIRWDHYLLCLLVFLGLDFYLFAIYLGKKRFPASTVIAVTSPFILMESNHSLFPFVFAGFIAVCSKYFLRFEKGHVFNPSNLGVLLAVLILPNLCSFTLIPWYWNLTWFMWLCAWSVVVLLLAGRLTIALSYTAFVLLFAGTAVGLGAEFSFAYLVAPQLGLSLFLFTFHMITDPATTSEKISSQILGGIFIAGLDMALRLSEYYYASLLALAIYCSMRPLVHTFSFLKFRVIQKS